MNMRPRRYPSQKYAPVTSGYILAGTAVKDGSVSSQHNVGNSVADLTIYDLIADYAHLPERYFDISTRRHRFAASHCVDVRLEYRIRHYQ